MIIDAADTPWGQRGDGTVLGMMLRRSDVVDTTWPAEIFGMVDHVVIKDERVRAFLALGEGV